MSQTKYEEQLREDKEIVGRLCDIEHGLTERQIDFIESVANRVDEEEKTMTDRQRDWARKILVRCGR